MFTKLKNQTGYSDIYQYRTKTKGVSPPISLTTIYQQLISVKSAAGGLNISVILKF